MFTGRLTGPCALLLAALPGMGRAQDCGGPFPAFLDGLRAEAVALGRDPAAVERFLSGVRLDERVLAADRRQGVFQRDFVDFARHLISADRIARGRENAARLSALFDRIEAEHGVPRGVLLAFWAFETDYGSFQGDYNTVNALVTLAHDCRRPGLFRPQVLAAIDLYERGGIDPATTTGAWAGEIGQVQMLPADILENGTDGDGDGRVDLKGSEADALTSGAAMLRALGWRAGEPWLQEIVVPDTLDWAQTGLGRTRTVADWAALGIVARQGDLGPADLPASVLLPVGREGPAFLAYPNFRVLFEWNQSLTYVITAAYFATRLGGAPVFDASRYVVGLSGDEVMELQRRLAARGHDVGGIDGILGELTRQAVRTEQQRLGLPADAWPTRALLDAL